MELTWIMRLRIAAAMGLGVLVLGFLAMPLVQPADPMVPVTFLSGTISPVDMLLCGVISVGVGFLAFFVAWPYGYEIGPLAVPAGLAVWAFAGDMFHLVILHPSLDELQGMYSTLRIEAFFWLVLVLLGWAGVWLARRVSPGKAPHIEAEEYLSAQRKSLLNAAAALLLSVVGGQILINVLAQGVRMFDPEVGSVVGQPGRAQVAFAAMAAFGVAAYVSKRYLHITYLVPIVGSALLVFMAITLYALRGSTLEYVMDNWPASFYHRATLAVAPVQMVAFASIGSVAGYWVALKMAWHQKHGS